MLQMQRIKILTNNGCVSYRVMKQEILTLDNNGALALILFRNLLKTSLVKLYHGYGFCRFSQIRYSFVVRSSLNSGSFKVLT
jgi:hypothetical protein